MILTAKMIGVSFVMPVGVIAMWHGLLTNIPSGWELCDGTNGTPDLRSKFLKGSAVSVNPGNTGGSATHNHDDHPAQGHTGMAISAHGTLSHSGASVNSHSTSSRVDGTGSSTIMTGGSHSVGQPTAHGSRTHSVTQPSAHAIESHVAENHEPEYYAVAFIRKT
jgi:hypothetical protein